MGLYLQKNKLLLAATLFTGVISSLGTVWIAVLLQQLLDTAMAGDLRQFTKIAAFSMFYFVLLGFFLYLQSRLGKKVIRRMVLQIRSDVFRGILRHSIEDFEKENTAGYLSVLVNDVKMLEDHFFLPFFEVVQYSVIFLSSFALMIYFNLTVTLCAAAAVTVMFLVPSLLGQSLEKRQSAFSSQLACFTVHIKDILSGFEIIRSYSLQKSVLARFEKINGETTRSQYSVDRVLALSEGLSAFLALTAQITVLFLSAYFIITGRITVGTLLGMVQTSNNLANPLMMIFASLPKMKSVQPIMEKLEKLSNVSAGLPEEKAAATYQSHIEIKNISFSYDGAKEVLAGVSCLIEKGKKYVILGKSGCGKSTLVKLLSGYYSDYKGEITYDGVELHLLDPDSVAQLSSVIHQNIYLFDETIYDNICLHRPYSEEQVEKALRDSGLMEWVAGLPAGLRSQVGENGANLSGGQKQRIAVARALIRNKPILILDEGTSSIDRQTAHDIESRLLQREDLTLLTITHHLDQRLLEQYDKVLCMGDGRVQERGSVRI